VIKRNIPNFITILNLFSGCVALVFAFNDNLVLTAWFLGFAAIFDFFDGMLARLLHVKSPLGVQLDSLADMVSFGVVPGVIMFQLMQASHVSPYFDFFENNMWSFAAFVIPVFSALRLAKFNIDERQTDSFFGLPTPANALFFASLPLVLIQAETLGLTSLVGLLRNYWFLLALTILFSGLMVSEIHLFSLKFKNFSWKSNAVRYILVGLSVVLFFLLKFISIPLIVLLYVLLSLGYRGKKAQ
jgi:CDP-diacylglycerol--serine O-phosphatidyltransferase